MTAPTPNSKTFPVWAESPSPAVVQQFIGQIVRQTLGDNRCPFCLGDVYTCGCGKTTR